MRVFEGEDGTELLAQSGLDILGVHYRSAPLVMSDKADSGTQSRIQADKADFSFGKNLKAALGHRDMAWLSRETGISTSTLSDYGQGKLPRADKALQIAHALGVSVESLMSEDDGQASSVKDQRRFLDRAEPENDDDRVEIASVDLAYGMGGTFLDVGDVDIEKVPFSRAWLRANVTDSPPEVLGVAQGIGDSMEPTLFDRDLVFFDRSARLEDHVSDKTWVFAFGQVGMIKRLRPMPDGTIKIMSANRTYPDEIATEGELHIIGRVVASLRRH